jgi:hypothetical protein
MVAPLVTPRLWGNSRERTLFWSTRNIAQRRCWLEYFNDKKAKPVRPDAERNSQSEQLDMIPNIKLIFDPDGVLYLAEDGAISIINFDKECMIVLHCPRMLILVIAGFGKVFERFSAASRYLHGIQEHAAH